MSAGCASRFNFHCPAQGRPQPGSADGTSSNGSAPQGDIVTKRCLAQLISNLSERSE